MVKLRQRGGESATEAERARRKESETERSVTFLPERRSAAFCTVATWGAER